MSRLAERFQQRQTQEKLRPPFSVEEVVVAGDLGPCGGVRMAIGVTNDILSYVAGREPVFANNEPVHNRLVTETFARQGLVIQPDPDKVPEGSIWILSAHGTDPHTVDDAKQKGIYVVNVECPLVTKVRREAQRAQEKGEHLIYRGAQNHPEPKAILGGLRDMSRVTFITGDTDPDAVSLPKNTPVRVLNQTTLSTKGVTQEIQHLREINPDIDIPNPMGICYATDNRQDSLYGMFSDSEKPVDFLIVVGSQNSHNSRELRNIGVNFLGPENAVLIDSPSEIKQEWFTRVKRVGLTSGASVLDEYTIDALEWFRRKGTKLTFLVGREDEARYEDLSFAPPKNDVEKAKRHIDLKYNL
jgi:4-hydroxy-3-methylbut-2-en-1-yl diphosphate reductase